MFNMNFYRDLPISEGLSLPTSSHLLSTSPHPHHTTLDAFHHALCRMTFLLDTTMTGHHITHPALNILKEIILEVRSDLIAILNATVQLFLFYLFYSITFYMHFIISLADMPGPPPHHHPNQRIPPPGMGGDHPPWTGGQHPDFGPTPHGFNGHSPHMRHRHHPVQEDPCLVPNVPYFDLPAGLMAPLVKVSLI